MAKFIPRNVDTVDAVQWNYHKPELVAEFMKFVGEHDLGVSFCHGANGGVAAEIHKLNVYHFDVEPYEYLVVEADGSIKKMDEDDFDTAYGSVS